MTETVEMKTASATPSETKLMKAIVRTRFGPPKVLQLKEVEKPVPNEVRGVLVKIFAAAVNPADRYEMKGPPLLLRMFLPLFKLNMGVFRPKDRGLGSDASGRVVEVTDSVSQFKTGDEGIWSCLSSFVEEAVTC